MRQLLWKEWHEQSWKLGFGCLMLGTLAVLLFHARMLSDETAALWLCYLGLTLLPILASTGLIPAERDDGTLEMLLALPMERWRVLLIKLLTGAALVVVPIGLAGAVGVGVTHGREVEVRPMIGLFARSGAAGAMLYLWMFAATVRLPSEARAGLIAVGVLIIWELLTAFLAEFAIPNRFSSSMAQLPSLSPLAFVFGMDSRSFNWPSLWLVALIQSLSAVGLWFSALWQLRIGTAAK